MSLRCPPLSLLATLAAAMLCARGPRAEAQDLLPTAREAEVSCMAQAIAYEAGYEPLSGQQAVAEVILNRTHNPRFPSSVCAVVYQGAQRSTGCQFTFTCDGSRRRRLPDRVMNAARAVASAALDNQIPRQVAGALNYHADYVQPYWSASMVRVARIGRHIFYRPPGDAYAGPPLPNGDAPPGALPAPLPSAPAPQGFSLWGLARPAISQH